MFVRVFVKYHATKSSNIEMKFAVKMLVYQIGNSTNIWRIDKPMFEFTIVVMIVDSQNMTWKSYLLKNVSEKKVEYYKKSFYSDL